MTLKTSPSHAIEPLRYPFGDDPQASNPLGEVRELADGVFWLRMPLEAGLDHINLWLLRDGDGWTAIDTGFDLPQCREVWQRLFAEVLGDRPIRRVIVTHMHPDHFGLAGWLCREFGCELWMTRTDYLMCRNMVGYTGSSAPPAAISFYRAAGLSDEQIRYYRNRFGAFGERTSPLPDSYRRIVHGETLQIGDHYWQVVVGRGHTPELALLYCPGLKLLISADQVLPDISSNVSVFPMEPFSDPLKDWLDSCSYLREVLPANLLVLPSHGEPFYGLHSRLTSLIESHESKLDRLYTHLAEPRRVVDCFPMLFRREIDLSVVLPATGEALAHLNCMLGRHLVRRELDGQGVAWYARWEIAED